MLDFTFQELDILETALEPILLSDREHLVGHVEAVGLAGRTDTARRQQYVNAATGAEIEHRLARLQLGQRCRVAASERRPQREVRHFAFLAGVVEIRGDRVAAGVSAAAGPPQHELPARRSSR